ncbi:hypothetical protein H6801_00160 [Candidatus Nomurabacteria bacterium]|jgi:hypothetical protein|nr:hypothetical protein [Candidatus Nomurabacteria bacterium]
MIYENGKIIDGQIDDGDPECGLARQYFTKIRCVLGVMSTRVVASPRRFHDTLLDIVDQADKSVGR